MLHASLLTNMALVNLAASRLIDLGTFAVRSAPLVLMLLRWLSRAEGTELRLHFIANSVVYAKRDVLGSIGVVETFELVSSSSAADA